MIGLLQLQFTCRLRVKLKTDTNYLGRLEGPKHFITMDEGFFSSPIFTYFTSQKLSFVVKL